MNMGICKTERGVKGEGEYSGEYSGEYRRRIQEMRIQDTHKSALGNQIPRFVLIISISAT
jgi:hypothetical protein